MSSPSAPALEGGSKDDALSSQQSKAIEQNRKAYTNVSENDESDNQELIVTSQGNKDGFEMVPLEDGGD